MSPMNSDSEESGYESDIVTDFTYGGEGPFTLVHPLSDPRLMAIRVEPTYLDDSNHETEIKNPEISLLNQVTRYPSEFDKDVFANNPATCENYISLSEFTENCEELSKEFDKNIQLCNDKIKEACLRDTMDHYSRGIDALHHTRSKLLDWIEETSTKIIFFNENKHKSDSGKVRAAIKGLNISDKDKRSELLEGSKGELTRQIANTQSRFSELCKFVKTLSQNESQRQTWSEIDKETGLSFDKFMKPQNGEQVSVVDKWDNMLKEVVPTVFGPDAEIPKTVKDWQSLCRTFKSAHEASAPPGASVHRNEGPSHDSDAEDYIGCSVFVLGEDEEDGTDGGFVLLGRE